MAGKIRLHANEQDLLSNNDGKNINVIHADKVKTIQGAEELNSNVPLYLKKSFVFLTFTEAKY